jgi:hypothetical protein
MSSPHSDETGELVTTAALSAPGGFLGAIASDGPHPDLAPHLGLFGQFVGSWDLDVALYQPDRSIVRVDGEWHFAWALEGRAIADVWICPSRKATDRRRGETGITVRFPDPATGTWRSTWIAPAYRNVYPFIGRSEGDEIVLDGEFEPGATRWTFSDITESSFTWRAESRRSADEPWVLETKFAASRVS